MVFRRFLSVGLLAVFVQVSARAGEPSTKPAPPDSASLRAALRSVEEVYKEQISQARDPESKTALAKKLIELAGNEADSSAKYALLSKSVEVADQAGDADTASAAIDEINAGWEVDALKLRAKALTEVSRYVRLPVARTQAARHMEAVAQQLIAARQFDQAREMRELAISSAQRGSDPVLARQLMSRAGDIGKIRAAEGRAKSAYATLKTSPSDPAANLAVGKCECFMEADWAAGLPKLASGSDAALKALAARELANPAESPDQLELADGWWDLAKREEEPARRNIQVHATAWYHKAVKDLTGLAKVRAQQRIAEGDALGDNPPSAVGAAGNIAVRNRTNASEAAIMISELLRDSPASVSDIREAVLVAYKNGAEFQHGGQSPRVPAQAYSPSPATADGHGYLYWGVHEDLPAGKYLFVFRIAALATRTGDPVCVANLGSNGDGLGSHRAGPADLPLGQWRGIPVAITLDKPRTVDMGVFTYQQPQAVALDRVYIYLVR